MNNKTNILGLIIALIATVGLMSCGDDEANGPSLDVPTTYTFERNGSSTVSYSGQTDRLNMLAEIKTLLLTGDAGNAVDATVLTNMYANEGSPFTTADLNASTKQLENKTFVADVQFFKDLMNDLGTQSAAIAQSKAVATEGNPGLLDRDGNGKTILVNEKGWEYTQIIEKGLMGAVFYNQIFNVYLTDARIGTDVDNETIVEGTNYTAKEHHWDEAFGYFGVPVDFPAGDPVLEASEDRFWANYTNDLNTPEKLPNVNSTLMNAYLTGRAAIVADDFDMINEQRDILYDWHEIVTAATAIHYINSTISDLNNNNDIANAFHHLSEAYAFLKAVQYSPFKRLTQSEINTILNSNFGTDANFWNVTISGLNEAKNTISSKYPELTPIKDIL